MSNGHRLVQDDELKGIPDPMKPEHSARRKARRRKKPNGWQRFWAWLTAPDPQPRQRVPSTMPMPDPPFAPLTAVVVHLKTEQAFKGSLVRVDTSTMTLKHASLATTGPSGSVNWTPMDGEVVLPLDNVDYWQSALDAAILGTRLDIPVR